jgi:uncharacterized protein Yka (UPF0111/DUF47 family)
VQQHLALTTAIVEDLEKAVAAAIMGDRKQKLTSVETVADGEKEADGLRRRVMDEISKGELAQTNRENIMELVKRVDMIADWSRESTRVLGALPMQHVPQTIKQNVSEMVGTTKGCARWVQECVNKMFVGPGEALQASDAVEREEEKVDDRRHPRESKNTLEERGLTEGWNSSPNKPALRNHRDDCRLLRGRLRSS